MIDHDEFSVVWPILLELKERFKRLDDLPESIYFTLARVGEEICFNKIPESPENHCVIVTDGTALPPREGRIAFHAPELQNLRLVEDQIGNNKLTAFLKLYLPVIMANYQAIFKKRSISFSHFAQTVDGRISTITGKSRWISCQENLIHSHRMRALCDGILIGTNTLHRDRPALTVRHVQGNNPVRIVIGNTACEFASVLKDPGQVIHLIAREGEKHPNVRSVKVPGDQRIADPVRVLEKLFALKILTLYVEGGAFTTSTFLSAGAIDQVQLYIAPKLFGSGIDAFDLPRIDKVEEAIEFENCHFFQMGDGVLFTGEPSANM